MDVVSRRGRVRDVELRLTETIAPGQVFVPFHYAEANANQADAERLRSDLARAQLQAVGRAGGAVCAIDMKRLVVVGNGMAGMACVEQILKYAPTFDITSSATRPTSTTTASCCRRCSPARRPPTRSCSTRSSGTSATTSICASACGSSTSTPSAKTVTGDDGSVTPYDTLLLATGSSALMPPIDGLDKDGVFAFRTLDDTRALLAAPAPGVKAVVIGGGLLGLEAARGLQVQGCDVTVVHLMRR